MAKQRKRKKQRKLPLDKVRQAGLKREIDIIDRISKAANEIAKKGRSPGNFAVVSPAVAEALSKLNEEGR